MKNEVEKRVELNPRLIGTVVPILKYIASVYGEKYTWVWRSGQTSRKVRLELTEQNETGLWIVDSERRRNVEPRSLSAEDKLWLYGVDENEWSRIQEEYRVWNQGQRAKLGGYQMTEGENSESMELRAAKRLLGFVGGINREKNKQMKMEISPVSDFEVGVIVKGMDLKTYEEFGELLMDMDEFWYEDDQGQDLTVYIKLDLLEGEKITNEYLKLLKKMRLATREVEAFMDMWKEYSDMAGFYVLSYYSTVQGVRQISVQMGWEV